MGLGCVRELACEGGFGRTKVGLDRIGKGAMPRSKTRCLRTLSSMKPKIIFNTAIPSLR